LKIAYFINQYPKVSHSFIRREILAMERQGFTVLRMALRGWDTPTPDAQDRLEMERTRYVLRGGAAALLLPALRTFLSSPLKFVAALKVAVRIARQAHDRPLIFHLIYVVEACRILAWMREFGARHLHAHFGTNSAEVALLARVLGGPPFSFTVHGPEEFAQPMALAEKIRGSAFVVAISFFGQSQLYLRLPHEDWPKVKVVRCGLETAFYEVPAVPLPAATRLVCVGRLCEEKGQLLLVEAIGRLAAKGIVCELVLVGDGPLRGELERLIEEHGVSDRVRITGWISSDAVRTEILAARALVLPSFAEGLPVVIMEAMALRRPVLSTYIAGIPELVLPAENGWLIPAGSLEDLVEALEICLSTPLDNLRKIGDAAYERAVARHSIDVEARKLGELILTGAVAGDGGRGDGAGACGSGRGADGRGADGGGA
jgi:glycosyltransferase involved in cell wall biosynthesis